MAINIVSLPVGIYMQSGNGVPTHISPKGTEYTDLDTAIVYINKDGVATWAEFLDSTFVITGGTSSYFTGGTVTGPTNFLNGVTANTISATTYYGLPTDIIVTGGTYSSGTILFTNNTGGTFTVTGLTTGSSSTTVIQFTGGTVTGATIFTGGVSANTISATTYLNLPTDIRVTGGTYAGGNILFTNNTGGTFNVTGITVTSGYSSNYYASFSNTNDIPVSGANIATVWTYDTTEISNGIVIQNNSKIKVNNTGVYEFGYSPQIEKTQGTDANVTIWAAINGVPVDRSSSTLRLVSNSTLSLPYVSLIFQMNANDYLEFYFSSSSQYVQLTSLSGLTSPTRPNSPALIVDVKQVGNAVTNTLTGSYLPLTGGTVSGATSYISGLTTNTISATTYQNLPNDIRVTGGTYSNGVAVFANNTGGTFSVNGFSTGYTLTSSGITTALGYVPLSAYTDTKVTGSTYSNNTFTFTNNTGGTFNTLFNTVTGLTVNGNLTVTGVTFNGGGTFTKAGYGAGDLILDNNGTDSPGLLLYYGNNNNWGVDTWNGTYNVLSGQLLRFTNNLNESGGAVKMAVDVYGNMVVNGFVSPGAWRAGQIIKDTILSNTEVTVNATTIATSSSDTDFISYSYTPVSSSSYLIIHYHLASYDASSGTGNDSWISRVKVDGNEITYSKQSTVNGNRSGVLFPLTGRYTNGNTTAKTIVIACRRDSGDDSIVITNSASSMWLRITEIAR